LDPRAHPADTVTTAILERQDPRENQDLKGSRVPRVPKGLMVTPVTAGLWVPMDRLVRGVFLDLKEQRVKQEIVGLRERKDSPVLQDQPERPDHWDLLVQWVHQDYQAIQDRQVHLDLRRC